MRTITDVRDDMTIISIVPDSDDRTPFTEALDLIERYEPETLLSRITEWADRYKDNPYRMGDLTNALNWKSYEHEYDNPELGRVYVNVWNDIHYATRKRFKGEDARVYFRITN